MSSNTFYLVSFGNSIEERFEVLASSQHVQPIGVLLAHYRKKYSSFTFQVFCSIPHYSLAFRVTLDYNQDLDLYSLAKDMQMSSISVLSLVDKFYA